MILDGAQAIDRAATDTSVGDEAAIALALSRSMADYRFSMLIGMIVNAWIGWRVATSLDLPAAWVAAAILPSGFALCAWSGFRAHQLPGAAVPDWQKARILFAAGTVVVALSAGVLAALAMAPTVPSGTALLAGLDAIAIMVVVADAAAGRPRLAMICLAWLAAAIAVPLALGSPDMMRHTAAIGVFAQGLVCLGIARDRHRKEYGLVAARLAERAALAASLAADVRLGAALQLMPQGVMIVSGLDGDIQFINQRLRDLLGLPPGAPPLGSPWTEVFRQATRLKFKTATGRQGLIERSADLV